MAIDNIWEWSPREIKIFTQHLEKYFKIVSPVPVQFSQLEIVNFYVDWVGGWVGAGVFPGPNLHLHLDLKS